MCIFIKKAKVMTAKEFFNEYLCSEPLTQERVVEALDEYYIIKKEKENNLPSEFWVDIPSYECLYQVSNLGRVKSLTRIIENKKGQIQKYTGKILTPRLSNRGYYQIALSENNNTKLFSVHKLVLSSFIGESDLVIEHKNRNTTDNRLDNLRYVTQQKNSFNRTAKGYWWNKASKKWQAKIMLDGKPIHLGLFDNEVDASDAYIQAKEKYHKFA